MLFVIFSLLISLYIILFYCHSVYAHQSYLCSFSCLCALFTPKIYKMASLTLSCNLCLENVLGVSVNKHLRQHNHDNYNAFRMSTTISNMRELYRWHLAAEFENKVAAFKEVLTNNGIDSAIMPDLTIDHDSTNITTPTVLNLASGITI